MPSSVLTSAAHCLEGILTNLVNTGQLTYQHSNIIKQQFQAQGNMIQNQIMQYATQQPNGQGGMSPAVSTHVINDVVNNFVNMCRQGGGTVQQAGYQQHQPSQLWDPRGPGAAQPTFQQPQRQSSTWAFTQTQNSNTPAPMAQVPTQPVVPLNPPEKINMDVMSKPCAVAPSSIATQQLSTHGPVISNTVYQDGADAFCDMVDIRLSSFFKDELSPANVARKLHKEADVIHRHVGYLLMVVYDLVQTYQIPRKTYKEVHTKMFSIMTKSDTLRSMIKSIYDIFDELPTVLSKTYEREFTAIAKRLVFAATGIEIEALIDVLDLVDETTTIGCIRERRKAPDYDTFIDELHKALKQHVLGAAILDPKEAADLAIILNTNDVVPGRPSAVAAIAETIKQSREEEAPGVGPITQKYIDSMEQSTVVKRTTLTAVTNLIPMDVLTGLGAGNFLSLDAEKRCLVTSPSCMLEHLLKEVDYVGQLVINIDGGAQLNLHVDHAINDAMSFRLKDW